jgi:hypothetical protein
MHFTQKRRMPHVRDGLIIANLGIERSSSVFLLLATALAAGLLYRFPPDRYAFYPLCPIHEYLHLECPGCGTTRAVSALLHGHLIAALHFNAFAILVLLPLVIVYAAICMQRAFKKEGSHWPAIPRPVTIALFALAAVFTIIRNL